MLFVHAHPGDETLLTGGTIATLVTRGAAVTVLTLTRGERRPVVDPELAGLPPAELAALRERELAAALAELGVTDHRWLGAPDARWAGRVERRYEDSGMRLPTSPTDPAEPRPGSLTAAEPGEVAADIAAVISAVAPHVVVAPDADAEHPDHLRAHHAARTAAEVMEVPFHVIVPPGTGELEVDVRPLHDRTRAALAAHRSQLVVEGDLVAVGDGPARAIPSVEAYDRVRGERAASFADFGWVSRIATCSVAAVLGAFAGGILTLVHQSTATIAGLPVPWGIVVAIVLSAALLLGLRLVFRSRVVALFAAIGLVGVALLLSLQLNGATLVPGNPIGYVWTFAPVVLSIVILGWPFGVRRRVRRT